MSAAPALVIFDCDGVLVDTEAISSRVLAQAVAAEGLDLDAATVERLFRGVALDDIRAELERRLGRALAAGWMDDYERTRAVVLRDEVTAVPGAGDAVRGVLARGLAACVASQGRLEKTRLTLGATGLLELFGAQALFSARMVARPKPAPDLFLHAAAAMGTTPARTIVVEDTLLGVRAAQAAGMRVLAYTGSEEPAALRAAGAETLDDLRELPERLAAAA